MANASRDPKKRRPFTPEDFNPYADRSRRGDVIEVDGETIAMMRMAFTGKKGENT